MLFTYNFRFWSCAKSERRKIVLKSWATYNFCMLSLKFRWQSNIFRLPSKNIRLPSKKYCPLYVAEDETFQHDRKKVNKFLLLRTWPRIRPMSLELVFKVVIPKMEVGLEILSPADFFVLDMACKWWWWMLVVVWMWQSETYPLFLGLHATYIS